MKFEKDVFISYAHIDDEPLVEGQKGWISEFHRSLEIRLAQLLGKKPVIWRDPKLQGNDHFADEIVDQLPGIALLVSVLSPRYVKSAWCVKEVTQFCEVSKRNIGVRVKNKSRIFKIIKTPVKREDHPEMIRDLLGYEFYRTDPQTGRAKELSKIFGADHEQAYWQKLDDLAYDIRDLLEAMTDDSKHEIKVQEKKCVYLAETTSDLEEYRESLRRELQQHGYHILPDLRLPVVYSDLKARVEQWLAQCCFSVHLVGGHYGIVPEGSQRSVVELQNELAAARSEQSGLPRIVWLVPDQKTDDARQSTFINALKTGSNAQAGADLLVTSLEEVKSVILARLQALSKQQDVPPQQDLPADQPPRVYLICDQQDLNSNSLRKLEDHLFAQQMEVILPVFEGDESQVRIEHQENLKTCNGVIIYFGAGNELWLRSKLRDLVKITGYGRAQPLKAKAVYVAEPESDPKERFRSHEVTVVRATGGFSGDLVKELIEKLKA